MSGVNMAMLTAINFSGSGVAGSNGADVGYSISPSYGSIVQNTYGLRNSIILTLISDVNSSADFAVAMGTVVSQDYFAFVAINNLLRETRLATFTNPGGTSSKWTWPGGVAGLVTTGSFGFTFG